MNTKFEKYQLGNQIYYSYPEEKFNHNDLPRDYQNYILYTPTASYQITFESNHNE